MRMGFDLDDVVFISLPGILDEGIRLGLIPDWVEPHHINGRVEEQWGISAEDMRRLLSVDFFERLKPNNEVVSDIQRWIDEGEEVFFITSRSDDFTPGIITSTAGCVERCGLLRGSKGVYHERSRTKWRLARDLELVSFVDDMPHVIRPMAGVIPHAYLLANEHNRDAEDVRRWSWAEVREDIETVRRSHGQMCSGATSSVE